MNSERGLKISKNSIWFGLLIIYVITSYIAQEAIMPTTVNSLVLYGFLAYSMFAIVTNGKIKLTPILVWELIFLAFSFVSMLYSPSFSIFGGTFYALLVNFILVFILTQMPWNELRFNMIMKTYVFSAALLIIILAVTGNLEDSSESGRLGEELTGNANILAMMLMVGAVCAVWLLVSENKKSTKVFSAVSLIIVYYGMFLSGGRKYIVAPIVFLYILLFFKKDKNGKKHIIRNTVIIAFIVFAVYEIMMNVPTFYNSIGHRFEGFFNLFGENQKVDSSTIVREKMIEAGWKAWPESPIWGHGFDSFKYFNQESVTGHFYYSHNNFIELLYNQGIIGFIVYYSFYIYLAYKALKSKGKMIYKGFVLGLIVSFLLFEYFAVTYSTTPLQIILFLCYYLLKNACEKGEEKNEQN